MNNSSHIPMPAPLIGAGIVVLTLALVTGAAVPTGSAQVQADEWAFALEARTCPAGYDGVAYAEECAEPLGDFAFDIAGPIDSEETTDDDGRVEAGAVPLGSYAVEALDFDPDDAFVVLCERPAEGGTLPVDIDYTDAGFEIDLAAAFESDLPEDTEAADGVTCAWYSVPDPPDGDRPGIVGVEGRRCDDEEQEEAVLAAEPGGDLEEIAERRAGCEPAPASIILASDETGDETEVEVETGSDQGSTLVGVPAGTYTATVAGTESSASVDVSAGEVTVVLVVTAQPSLAATFEPGPTAAADPTDAALPTVAPEPLAPTVAPEPLAPIEFGPGDWQDAFPNIDTGVYDRAAVAVYGQFSPFPSASLRFDLPAAPADDAVLTVVGLGDELGPVEITVTVNGEEVYRGPSGFAGWDPSADSPAWTPVDFAIPAGLLVAGGNEITIANLAESAAFGLPPYVLLTAATLTFAG